MHWLMVPLPLPGTSQVQVWAARLPGHDGSERGPAQVQRQRLLARELLGRALKAHWGLEPDRWRLTRAASGAPLLELADAGLALRCSFAHADGATLCAVGPAASLGVDLERLRSDDRLERLARRVCSADEQVQLAACRARGLRGARFLGLWTLKEAWAKAHGAGALASVPLRDLSFDLRRDLGRGEGIAPAERARRSRASWRFHRFAVGLRHVAALAWEPASR